jgi:outer membrane protein/protease secretion system outer membrane protein
MGLAKKFVRRVSAAAALLMAGQLAGAQPAPVLDLLGAYQLAMQNDASLRAVRAAADAQREQLPQALAQLRPQVALSAYRGKNDLTRTQPNFLGQPVTTNEQYFSHNETLSVRQALYRPALWAGVRQAQAIVADAEASVRTEEANLASKVTAAYLDALFARDQLALVREQVRVARVQLDAAQKAFQAGTGIRTDIDEVQARLDVLQADELRARQQVDLTARQLEVLTGRSFPALAALDAGRLQLLAPEPLNLGAWVALAEANSPELAALSARREAAARNLERQEAAHKPTLDAVAQVTRSASENVTSPSSSYTNRVIGLQFNLPLYAGGAVQSSVRQAQAELTRAEEILEATRRDLGVRVHREFRGVVEGIERVKALQRVLASAEQVVVSTQRSYAAGTRTLLDVLNAQQQRQVALRDLAQARYEYLLARVRLAALAGAPVDVELAQINATLAAGDPMASTPAAGTP